MKFVCISDTHGQIKDVILPDGDVLLHSGDHTSTGNIQQMSNAMYLLGKKGKKFKHVICIAGNHDGLPQDHPEMMRRICKDNNIIYLQDESITIDGIKIYGAPWQPFFNNWFFNLPRGQALIDKWAQIPEDTRVLLTHGPAYKILDECPDGSLVGCEDLLARIKQLPQLTHHVFGHIHHSHGTKQVGQVTHINASTCTEAYKPINKPIVFDI